jgi:hypothetical protein
LGFEIVQFLGMIGFFVLAGFLWVGIIYRPGRTLERWEGDRTTVSSWEEERSPVPPAGQPREG